MKKARFRFPIDPLEGWSAVAGLVVFIGLGFEVGPEAWGYLITWYEPPRELFGSALVAIGVFAEVAIGIFIARSAKRMESESNKRIAELNERASQADLDRAKIEEELFKAHVITPEMLSEIRLLLDAFSGAKKRVDVFVYDQHLTEPCLLADSLNVVFGEAGWDSKMWVGAEPRMVGTEVIFSVSGDCPMPESQAFQILAGRLAAVLFIAGIGVSMGVGGLSRKPLGSWGERWNPDDIAIFRVQVGERQIRSDLFNLRSQLLKKGDTPDRPVTPPQA